MHKSKTLPFGLVPIFTQSNYFAGNLIWNFYHSLTVGTEFLFGWCVNKTDASGNVPRIMLSPRYNFIGAQAELACMEQVDEQSLDK